MHLGIAKIVHILWESVLPRRCAGCKAPGEALCGRCLTGFYQKGGGCVFCNQRNGTGSICGNHERPKALKKVFWAGQYKEGLKDTIWQLKYRRRKELAAPLGWLLARKFTEFFPHAAGEFIIIPVPLHYAKQKERGYNQTELLAREFANLSNIQCLTNVLKKTKDTPPQVKSESKETRIKNLENAFEARLNNSTIQQFNHSTIVLVDDVSTTGATLAHASWALEKAGVKYIIGLVAAHG